MKTHRLKAFKATHGHWYWSTKTKHAISQIQAFSIECSRLSVRLLFFVHFTFFWSLLLALFCPHRIEDKTTLCALMYADAVITIVYKRWPTLVCICKGKTHCYCCYVGGSAHGSLVQLHPSHYHLLFLSHQNSTQFRLCCYGPHGKFDGITCHSNNNQWCQIMKIVAEIGIFLNFSINIINFIF